MKTKRRLVILFGGKSGEHEVSVCSAQNVYRSLDKRTYDIALIGIDPDGVWSVSNPDTLLSLRGRYTDHSPSSSQISHTSRPQDFGIGSILPILAHADVVFPVLHGPYGEDGRVQGFLELLQVPYIGSNVLGSAIAMDKEIMKRILENNKISIAPWIALRKSEAFSFKTVVTSLGLPVFVKPSNLGSSIGITKAHTLQALKEAITIAFSFDSKIVIEKAIVGREIECSVFGNDNTIASIPGEIKTTHEFYDYEAKYTDGEGTELVIPARLTTTEVKSFQSMAITVFRALNLRGMARIDFFYTPNHAIIVNEANTIPGFTDASMYTKLWEAGGMKTADLLDKLIQLAMN